ncbi:MAG: efflux RND transporter periplasmic adaptor subunit [Deltaproteobacteria bacterium]|nr:efflux RND transporter periplasmic adaptor subunit [Deltaproteobacteria bacterium]
MRTWLPFVLFLTASACREAPSAGPAAPEPAGSTVLELSDAARASSGIELETAGPREARARLAIQGDVSLPPAQQASVVAKVPGVIQNVRKRVGDSAKRGEILAILESRDLADAKMAYFEAEHTLDFASKALTREKRLVDKGISSQEAYQEKQHALEEAKVAHAGTLQRLKILGFQEVELHDLKKDLKRNMATYRVRAPVSGQIIKEAITLGASVSADEELFLLADLGSVSINVNVPVKEIRAVQTGLPVKVFCTQTDLESQGKVTWIGAIADRATRTVPVRIEIDNADGNWRPGMAARVEIESSAVPLPVAVSPAAVHQIEGKTTLFVEQDGGGFEARNVEVGHQDDHVVEITSGLRAGERVASTNSFVLKAEWLKREGG